MIERLLGQRPLPWEEGAPGAPRLLRRLGQFRSAILALLDRSPSGRPSMATFQQLCRAVLLSSSRNE